MNAKILAALALFAGLYILDNRCAFGCDCLGPSFRTARREASSVFSGTVTDMQVIRLRPDEPLTLANGQTRVTFKVSRIWKGNKAAERIVSTYGYTTCSFDNFTLDREYLVFANGEESNLSVGHCSRTALISDAREDLKELGAGDLPVAPKSK